MSAVQERRIYLDALQEAMDKARPKLGRPPRRRVSDIEIRQLRLVEQQQIVIVKAMGERKERCVHCQRGGVTPAEMPDLVKATESVTEQLVKLSKSIRLGQEAERRGMEGLTEEQLEMVFRAQLTRLAPKLSAEERKAMCAIWFGDEVAGLLVKQAVKP